MVDKWISICTHEFHRCMHMCVRTFGSFSRNGLSSLGGKFVVGHGASCHVAL